MKKTGLLLIVLASLVMSACGAGPGQMSSGAYQPPMSSSASTMPAPSEGADAAGESYLVIDENTEKATDEESMLTFSLKVDTAAYSNVQRYLESGSLPPKDAVRTEELINYFRYDAPMEFNRDDPFALYAEVAPSPFDSTKQIAFVRVKTPEVDKENLPSSNLTFLIDSSGSMNAYDKLPLLKQAFSLLVDTLDEDDRVSIVTYAGSSAVVLDSARGSDKRRILSALDQLDAGGSTAGAEGILTAYRLAEQNYIKNGNNRVILATDGDFNVGPSSNDDLSELVQRKRDNGVYLSILGFGTGNIRDDLMETLSRDGNGNYAYINSVDTAKKVLVEELSSNLFTVADDVKAQVEFNPTAVASYRLIGYENRALQNKDFTDDTKDAGEIGAGTDVVVLFELTLQDGVSGSGMKYQSAAPAQTQSSEPFSDELFEVRIRYKDPGESESKLMLHPVKKSDIWQTGSSDLQFACAVAEFGQLLRGAETAASARDIIRVAEEHAGENKGGYRRDFVELVALYRTLADT